MIRALRQAGVDAVAHVRPDSPSLALWRDRFATLGARVDTTPWEPEAIATTLAALQPALVFGLLGTTRARGKHAAREGGRIETYATVDFGLTMLLYQAARRCGSRPRFVYLSAVGVTEGSRNAYLAVRARMERALKDGDLPYLIARPSFITGPDRDEFRAGERISARATDLVLRVVGLLGARRMRERYRSTTSRILARSLVRLALDPGAANRIVESEDLR